MYIYKHKCIIITVYKTNVLYVHTIYISQPIGKTTGGNSAYIKGAGAKSKAFLDFFAGNYRSTNYPINILEKNIIKV